MSKTPGSVCGASDSSSAPVSSKDLSRKMARWDARRARASASAWYSSVRPAPLKLRSLQLARPLPAGRHAERGRRSTRREVAASAITSSCSSRARAGRQMPRCSPQRPGGGSAPISKRHPAMPPMDQQPRPLIRERIPADARSGVQLLPASNTAAPMAPELGSRSADIEPRRCRSSTR